MLELAEDEDSGPVKGALFDHFLPSALLTKTDINYEINRLIVDVLIRRKSGSATVAEDFTVGVIWGELHPLMPDYDGPDPGTQQVTAKQLAEHLATQALPARRRVTQTLRENRDRIARTAAGNMAPAYWLNRTDLPRHLRLGFNAIYAELRALRYLGPLRIQPSPIYPVATTLGSQDVGPSGEWTASVLDEHKEMNISYVSSRALPFKDDEPAQVSTSLLKAVDDWMNYLGVASSVQTVDRGSLGHEIKVARNGSSHFLPLTHVGVGVSQCLPVVVSLLLAPRGSITLLEQPELHLHPAVQSRLADFLLAMSLSGRQCLVETHSEYLVNRLRLRVAQGSEEALSGRVAMYFADNASGNTEYAEIALNQYGAIENWPKGFFDETQNDIESILRAGMSKRRVRRDRASRD